MYRFAYLILWYFTSIVYADNIAIIGGGFSGLMAAVNMAKKGHSVELYEQNNYLGGRLIPIQHIFTDTKDSINNLNDLHIHIGPSWYWMNDMVETTLNKVGNYTEFSNYKFLNPNNDTINYRVFHNNSITDIYNVYNQSAPFNLNFISNQKRLYSLVNSQWLENDYNNNHKN